MDDEEGQIVLDLYRAVDHINSLIQKARSRSIEVRFDVAQERIVDGYKLALTILQINVVKRL